MAARVCPSSSSLPRSWHITRGRDTLSTVIPSLVRYIRSAHPGPLARAVLPKIVEESFSTNRIVTEPAEQPEIPRRVGPTDSYAACSRNITHGRDSQCAVGAPLVGDI